MNPTREQRRLIRAKAGCGREKNIKIVVVPGVAAPVAMGDTGHYETAGGRRINHPSSYSRTGWSNMHYVASDRRIEVGEEWVKEAR